MDTESYEDTLFGEVLIGNDKQYLVEGNFYDVLLIEGKAIRLQLPASVEATVIEAPDAVRGDTASNVQKPVTIASGMVVQVPLFIKKDEVIKVSTADGSYLGRA
jgi:elongation factor P